VTRCKDINFNAQHSPTGAFMSFTCGHFGTRGGFGLEIGKPGNQDLFIGVKHGDRFADAPLKCLPFFQSTTGRGAGAADFQVEQAAGPAEQNVAPKVQPYRADQIQRDYGWASDRWVTSDFEFAIYTPFFPLPEPSNGYALQLSVLPAVIAELTVDNTRGTTPKTAFFAIGFSQPGARLFDTATGVDGFAWRRSQGVRAVSIGDVSSTRPFLFMRWTPDEGLAQKTPHQLGSCPGVGITIPAGKRGGLRLALGVHLDGIVTTGLEGRYYYTRAYGSLPMVLDAALTKADHLIEHSALLDRQLHDSGLSSDQQFLIAHATRSYYGSTQLLDVAGQPFWVVNEGEYCMINTLDLSVDQVFWELKQNPWVVRNQLDNFVRYYSYHDQVKDGDTLAPGGISFCHDMGAHNNFSPFGQSSYELPDLTGCFSYMTAEQLCNWSLTAACYVAYSRDVEWAKQNAHILSACYDSLANRSESGWIDRDSARCGSGSEITTYDSLDESLGQARANLYLAIKTWAAVQGLRMIDRLAGSGTSYSGENEDAVAIESILLHTTAEGVLPAVFEPENAGFRSRILPAIEAFIYPWYWERCGVEGFRRETTPPEMPASWTQALRRHTLALLHDVDRRNLFPDGGIKLSSTSNNSWMSKIAIFQHVAREVFHLDDDPKIKELFAKADAAHVKWQIEGSGYWACSDQFVSGVAKGSRYYPRIITTALWMKSL
jgi:hypothetical protein